MAASPESIFADLWLWIPGSSLREARNDELPRPILTALRIALQFRQRVGIDRIDRRLPAQAVELAVDALHLLHAPAHQGDRSDHSKRHGKQRVHDPSPALQSVARP